MGFFSKYNEIEKGLLDLYTQELGSAKMAENLLELAIKESKKINLPANMGDNMLEKEKDDEKMHRFLEKARKESVRDEDIRWWWNSSDVERIMMLKFDEFNRMVLFRKVVEEDGKTGEEAGAVVRKYHPIYGNPEDTTNTQGEDRPLREELKNRINIYVEKQGVGNTAFKKKLDSFSTFNALIRKEISDGNI